MQKVNTDYFENYLFNTYCVASHMLNIGTVMNEIVLTLMKFIA